MHDCLYLLLNIKYNSLSDRISYLNLKIIRIDIKNKEPLILYRDSRKRKENNAGGCK